MAFRKAYFSLQACSLKILSFFKNRTRVFKVMNLGLILYTLSILLRLI